MLRKALHVEARAADERAVDVRFGDELADVVRLDAAAVDHVAVLGGVLRRTTCRSRVADVCMRLCGLRGRGVPARADGPHRLVGHDEVAHLLGRDGL